VRSLECTREAAGRSEKTAFPPLRFARKWPLTFEESAFPLF
jgi:hypothetical protein